MAKINTTQTLSVSDAEIDRQLDRLGAEFDGMEKVKIRLPKNPGTDTQPLPVIINGKRLNVPRGVTVEVPKPFAEILERDGYC